MNVATPAAKQAIEEIRQIVLKNYRKVTSPNGAFMLDKLAEIDPVGFAKITKHYQSRSGFSVLLFGMRKKGLIGVVQRTDTVQALVPVSRQTSLIPATNGGTSAKEIKELFLQIIAHFKGRSVVWSKAQDEIPELYQKASDWAGGSQKKLRNKINSMKHSKKVKAVLNGFRHEEQQHNQPEPEPASQCNFCPQCGFQIGLVIKAVNTITKLKR